MLRSRRKLMKFIKQIGLVLLCVGTLCTATFAEATPAISRPGGNSGIQMDDAGTYPYVPNQAPQSYQYEAPRFQYRPTAKKVSPNQTVTPGSTFPKKKASPLTFGQMADSIKKTSSSSQSFSFKSLADKLKEKKPSSNSLNNDEKAIRRENDIQ
jgi:hypothetical protein